MSKSKGNYIGITEPPKVMYRKIMGISDDLMWRYWELLTDVSLGEIAALKQREPMEVKIDLAGRIVADFHSQEAARHAAEDFNREVRQGAEPEDIPVVAVKGGRLASVLVTGTVAPSRTEAERLIKAGAVEVDGERCTNPSAPMASGTHTIRAGKKWVRVTIGQP
jgi:tyrosyl-tRNA synthetase